MKNMRKGNGKRSTKHIGKGEVFSATKRHRPTQFQEKIHVTSNIGS